MGTLGDVGTSAQRTHIPRCTPNLPDVGTSGKFGDIGADVGTSHDVGTLPAYLHWEIRGPQRRYAGSVPTLAPMWDIGADVGTSGPVYLRWQRTYIGPGQLK